MCIIPFLNLMIYKVFPQSQISSATSILSEIEMMNSVRKSLCSPIISPKTSQRSSTRDLPGSTGEMAIHRLNEVRLPVVMCFWLTQKVIRFSSTSYRQWKISKPHVPDTEGHTDILNRISHEKEKKDEWRQRSPLAAQDMSYIMDELDLEMWTLLGNDTKKL